MSMIVDWKLADPDILQKLFSNEPLGSPSLDSKPAALELASSASFGGDDAGKLTLNARGALSVAVMNDPTDQDEDGILGATPVKTAGGTLPPQLMFDPARVRLKYRAQAGLKAAAGIPIHQLVGIDAGAEASAVFADYRAHLPEEPARDTITTDLLSPRFVTRCEQVLGLDIGEALAYRFAGTLDAAITVRWSDIFTGQIGTLSTRLGATAPITMSARAGASATLNVRVSDDFLVVFSRAGATEWRVGVRKVKSSRIAPSVDAGIDVGFANPKELQAIATATLDGLLGAPLKQVESILAAASLESLEGAQRRIALALLDRFGVSDGIDALETLRERVEDARARAADVIEQVVKTRIALSFTYEYSRVSADTSLVQATLDDSAVKHFHSDLIRMRTERLAEALRERRPGVSLEIYLNQKEITRTRSYGFTLGFGKWASVGGRDFKKTATVRRLDLHDRVQETYLNARSYTGRWGGEKTEWGVDLKAEMKDYAAEPLVNDYSFGIHLFWAAGQRSLSGAELEEWLDAALIWRVIREQDLVDVRGRLAGGLNKPASLSVHLTIPNTVVRSILPGLATAAASAFAPALAVAMPWMHISAARTSAARRRQVYAPLWALYLKNPNQPQSAFARAAADHVKREGHHELVLRESAAQHGPDPFAFAGLTHINGNTRNACDAFTRGAGVLHSAIANGARNQKTIDKAVSEMDDLWTQSHHVRAAGAYLLEAADRAGVLGSVTRTLTVEGDAREDTLVVTA